MSSKRPTSIRQVKLPSKFGDSICNINVVRFLIIRVERKIVWNRVKLGEEMNSSPGKFADVNDTVSFENLDSNADSVKDCLNNVNDMFTDNDVVGF
ncbi:hypothetical protein Tco_0128853 [Tanacetum coccineum]